MNIKLFLIIALLAAAPAAVNAQESTVKTALKLEKTAFSFKPETELKVRKNRLAADEENSAAQANSYVRPDAEKRFKRYLNNAVGLRALAINALGAGISTAANEPEEWNGNLEGFGRRFASNTGRNAIRETVIYGIDEALKTDSEFYRSEKRDTGSRVKNALLSTVTARKPDGQRTLGVSRIVGTYSAHIIAAEAWYPKRFDYKDGLKSGTISLGINAAFNLFREFIWKK